ncbi:MAG: hypothetical protein J5883_06165 [Clostridiales bacterium]|nr:hypothetical protein [Clostridiales bacterium]
MAQTFPTIDYEDMISDISEDIEAGYITLESTLYIVRQATAVNCEACGKEVFPVLEFFYETPELFEELREMTVEEAKKVCYAALETLSDEDSLKTVVAVLAEDLKEYTAGNGKRNSRPCRMLFEKSSLAPMMIYFDDSDAGDKIEKTTAGDLLEELRSCM